MDENKIQLHGIIEEETLEYIRAGADRDFPAESSFFIKTQVGYLSMNEIARLIEKELGDKPFVITIRESKNVPTIRRFSPEIMSDVLY